MGFGRSGSTILDNLLGELDGFFSLGELHNLWLRGLIGGQRCGCRAPIESCEVWSTVLSEVFDDSRNGADRDQIVRWQAEAVRVRNTRRLLRQETGRVGWKALDAYVRVLSKTYEALSRITGARVLVDSSKRPQHGALLHLVEGIRPWFVHLVRDPRAVAYSRQRTIPLPDGEEMGRYGPFHVSSRWVVRNIASHMVRRRYPPDRSLLVRYEDFVARPRSIVDAIAQLVDEYPTTLPFVDERTVLLGINHSVCGNPSRYKTGLVELRLDDEWRSHQRLVDRFVTTAVSLPLLSRYGYPVLAGPTPSI